VPTSPRPRCSLLTRTLAAATALALAASPAAGKRMPTPPSTYEVVVNDVANMVGDQDALEKVHAKGLQIVNVMWEDTGRWEGSSVGPNISDVTIEVESWRNGKAFRRALMPVIRHDNFADKTADVKLDKIFLPVGNQRGDALKTISLRQLLEHPSRYLSNPGAGRIKGGSLLAPRDSHALVSAQHAFLPVPRDGKATFWPVIFNYQSMQKDPAVLTLVITRQGTSMTIIDNARDTVTGGASWGQRLYFNHKGDKAPLIAERLKDVQQKGTTANGEAAASLGDDANLLMIVQVPLKQKARPRRAQMAMDDGDAEMAPMAMGGGGMDKSMAGRSRGESDVDVAVLGHGETEGKYTELDGLTIERDPRFPVRVTVQFYQATSNGVVSQADIDRMHAQIQKVYAKGDYVGSLVVPAPSDRVRPTVWTGATRAPTGVTWYSFPGLQERYARFGWFWYPESAVSAELRPAPAPSAGIAE
jgi:hypothetical protein